MYILIVEDPKFPAVHLQNSETTKKTLVINPRARFLIALENESVMKRNARQVVEQKRAMASQDQDWGILKQLSKEVKFQNYINSLIRKGRCGGLM